MKECHVQRFCTKSAEIKAILWGTKVKKWYENLYDCRFWSNL